MGLATRLGKEITMKQLHPVLFALAGLALLLASWSFGSLPTATAQASAATVSAAEKPYIVEWVYRVKWGHKDEFFDIFKKYQLPVLAKEKQLGYVADYSIYSPSLHTSQDSRWDYRVIIVYKNQGSTGHAEEISKQLFPDRAALKVEEQRRWELTEVHWDLPIHLVDPDSE
jgi:hypothetical protein